MFSPLNTRLLVPKFYICFSPPLITRYVGRKILEVSDESWVPGVPDFVRPAYSYWTVSYIISLSGAKKLLAQEPLGKMVPVDEYLPIMFDKHPE